MSTSSCSAAVSGTMFDATGNIRFTVDAGTCTDSAGTIEYSYQIKDAQGKVTPSSRRCTWPRQHGTSRFTASDLIVVHPGESLESVSVSQTDCDCATASAVRSASYSFDEQYPPLLIRVEDPLATAISMRLRHIIGTASWEDAVLIDEVPYGTGGGGGFVPKAVRLTSRSYQLIRTKEWVPAGTLRRYATEVKETIELTEGYERTEFEEFRNTLTTKLTASAASAKLGGLSLGLDLTQVVDVIQRLTQIWKQSQTTKLERTFEAHHQYLFWRLQDTVTFAISLTRTFTDPTDQSKVWSVDGPKVEKTSVTSIVKYFEDDGSDPGKNF